MKLFPVFLAVALCFALPLRAGWWDDAWLDPALLEAHSLEGGSGFIHVPSPQSLPPGLLTGAIHRYRAKLGRGFPLGLEAGFSVELEGWNMDEAEKRNLLYVRWAPLSPARHGLGLAFGAEGVGFEDLGFGRLGYLPRVELEADDRLYAVAGAPLPGLPMFYAAAGYSGGRRRPSGGMGVLAFAPFAGIVGLVEYDEQALNAGLRVLLSTQIKLDLSLGDILSLRTDRPFADVLNNNLRFGVSYSERWP